MMKLYRKKDVHEAIQLTRDNVLYIMDLMKGERTLTITDESHEIRLHNGQDVFTLDQWLVRTGDRFAAYTDNEFKRLFSEVENG